MDDFHLTPEMTTITNFGTVVSGRIYRGGQPVILKGPNPGNGDASQYAELSSIGVRTLIDLRENIDRDDERRNCAATGIAYVSIPIGGLGDLSLGILPPTHDQMALALNTIQNAYPVFVHCAHGEDRTGAVVAGYRMVVDGWNNGEALAEARAFHLNPLQVLIREWIENFAVGDYR